MLRKLRRKGKVMNDDKEEPVLIKLGDKCRDTVSGFAGVAIAEHKYITGCVRFSLQPPVDKDGKLPDTQSFDSPMLEKVEEEVVSEATEKEREKGGPEQYRDTARPE